MSRLTSLIVPAAALTACAAVPGTQPAAPAGASDGAMTCSNEGLGRFAGQAATSNLATEILRTSRAKTLQWVAAGTMVTMDFRPERVRVYLDKQNKVQRVSCG